MQYEKVKAVTLALISLKNAGDLVHVRFDTPFVMGKKLKGDDSKKEPAHLAQVTDLDTGEEKQMIGPSVLRSTLEEEYPDAKYVGKFFEIENLGKKAGRGQSVEGYNLFRIVEVKPIGDIPKAAGLKAASGGNAGDPAVNATSAAGATGNAGGPGGATGAAPGTQAPATGNEAAKSDKKK